MVFESCCNELLNSSALRVCCYADAATLRGAVPAAILGTHQGVRVCAAMLRGAVLAAVVATATAGARDAWQASLQANKRDWPPPRSPIWDKSFRCVVNGKNASTNAYAVVLGPISRNRKYSKWVYPILALKTALKKRGSRADVLALLALEEDKEHHRMLLGREAMQLREGWGAVSISFPKPRIRDFTCASVWKSKFYGA